MTGFEDSELEPIAKEVKRIGRMQTKVLLLVERLDAEMDRLWHEIGLRRARREGSPVRNRKDRRG